MRAREEWLEELPAGWRVAFGDQLVDDVIALAKKYNFEDEYEVLQIKEKYADFAGMKVMCRQRCT